jgi:lysophospholipase L1-like esterase
MAKYRVSVLSLALIWLVASSLPVSSQSATAPLPGTQSIQEARSLTVVQEPAGDLWAAWEADTGTDVEIYFSRWTSQGWATPKPVHSRPQAWDYDPSLTIAADGQLWLAWSSAEHGSPRQSKLYVSRWTGTGWTEPEPVPTDSLTRSREPVLAAPSPASAGHLLSQGLSTSTLWLAWVGYDDTGDGIFASRWDGKTWQSPQQVSAPDDDPVLYDRQPQLAVDRDGKPWLVWTGHEGGLDDEIYVSRWTGDAWTPEQMVNQDDDELDVSPSLVLDAQDQPWVAWEGILPGGDLPQSRIMVSHWDPAREAWTPESVASSPPEAEILETSPTLAFHPDGQMHLAWVASDFSTSVVVHAQRIDGQWAAPHLVGAALVDEPVVLISVADGSVSALRIGSLQDGQVPLERLDLDPNAELLAQWIKDQPAPDQFDLAAVANRYLAFGDSITWGLYTLIPDPVPYPTILEQSLDTRVKPSAVINSGVPGNSTYHGVERIKTEVPYYQPQFVLYMLGTNDVTRSIAPSKVRKNIDFTIRIARQSGVPNVEVMVATIIPRSDGRFDETEEMNELGIIPAAQGRNAPLCDQWQAFLDYGPWRDILVDGVHPKQVGLQLLADTFYGCILDTYTWLQEESVPPVISLQLPAQTDCTQVNASWSGTDNLSWVVDYDVQIKAPGSSIWTDWLLKTQATSTTYSGGVLGDTVGFRVRGRDVVGNQSDYNLATKYTTLVDNTPPEAHLNALPPYQVAPFSLSWTGTDSCSGIHAYDVQRKVGSGSWQNWLTGTTSTSATFVPDPPQYGQVYWFQVRAQDGVGLWSAWSQVSTTLARFALEGNVYNVRHEPVIGATLSLAPAAAHVRQYGGGFTAYLMAGGNYDIQASRNDRFGTLPPMHQAVSANVTGLEFILPPQAAEDAVTDGGFEQGTLAAWQVGGTQPPELNSQAHTGDQAVLLGGMGHSSVLSQTLSVPGTLTDATLSFLVKLENPAGDSSAIDVELVGTSISHTQAVLSGEWVHVWFPVEAAAGQAVTLRFAVSDHTAVYLDEVSLGSALPGGSVVYMPIVGHASTP